MSGTSVAVVDSNGLRYHPAALLRDASRSALTHDDSFALQAM